MDTRIRHGVLGVGATAVALLFALPGHGTLTGASAVERQDSLPPSVTTEMISEGARLFGGAGLCMACHGPNAKGLPNLGPDLTDTTWVHSDGSFEQLTAQISKGVPAGESQSGVIMPPRGGSSINDEQVRAVAAYVWSLRLGQGGR